MAKILHEIMVELETDQEYLTFRLSANKENIIISNDKDLFLPIPILDWMQTVEFIKKEINS